MRLGFYYHIPALISENGILCPGYLGRFLDFLAEYLDLSLFLHKPDPNEKCNFDYTIKSKNISLVQLPPRNSFPYRLIHQEEFLRIIRSHTNNLDGFLIRGPSPLLPSIARSLHPIPLILLIVGDYLAGISSLPQPAWRKIVIRLFEWLNYRGQLNAAKHSLVFVNSRLLYNHYKGKINNLIETRTTTLTDQDFFFRQDTCLRRPVHILYSGRMDPSKGLFDMVQAVTLLVKQGQDVVLDLVGWLDGDPHLLEKIDEAALNAGVKDRVKFHGYKAVGRELFEYYRQADIYLTASQASEGFPRTIWEAMANSLPVVATNVGSIPDYIGSSALVVEPRNPSAIANAITELLQNPKKRQSLIKSGFQLAKENTLEKRSKEMVEAIISFIQQK